MFPPRLTTLALIACLAPCGTQALVGESSKGGAMAPHVVMVLASRPSGAGFCTAVVIAPEAILTAAHCVAAAKDTRVFIKIEDTNVFIQPSAISVHPDYKSQALRTRERSIDLALIKIGQELPRWIKPVDFDERPQQIGARYGIAGFGVTKEGAGESAGILRWGVLVARPPLSKILLWAEGSKQKGLGACEGDSGGPVFALDTSALLAITSWSAGEGKARCGALTQAALIAPQRNWIEATLKGWQITR